MRPVLLIFEMVILGVAFAQTPAGAWVTIDEDTGEATSVIVIEEQGGILTGRIDSLINPDDPNPLCDRCDGEKHNQPILGMQIIWGMGRDGCEWSGGRILDPQNGKTYRCKMWMEGDRLFVRGYVGPFRRTQAWPPFEGGANLDD